MSSLDFLDQITNQADQESIPDFQPHPLGSYAGVVTEVKQKTIKDKPVWEIFVKTAHGVTNHNRWGFSPAEMSLGAQRTSAGEEQRDKMVQTVARHKRLFVEMGIFTAEEAKSVKWNDILGSWVKLQGRPCNIVVKPDQKKQGYTMSFLNGPNDKPDLNEGSVGAPPPKSSRNGSATPFDDDLKPPGLDSDLGSIPF
jgi:hypothetical protein